MTEISYGTYKNIDAVVLENADLRVTLLPQWGSKIVSIIYKPDAHDVLWQEPGEEICIPADDAPYGRTDSIGFDEMFPTISRCFYENAPWTGIEMQDHGEVRALPWTYEMNRDNVRLWVHGLRFPYRLEKTIRLNGTTISIDYTAANLSPADLEYIWAAHPLFNASPDMELTVPPGMNSIINAVPGATLSSYGKQYHFPQAALDNGAACDLAHMPARGTGGYQKYYFREKVTEGWCLLYDPAHRLNIGLVFPKETVPYLGMWVNAGGWGDQYVIAPEPASGAMDRVDAAKLWGMNSVLPAHGSRSWFLQIVLQTGERMLSL